MVDIILIILKMGEPPENGRHHEQNKQHNIGRVGGLDLINELRQR
ncbi:hypothetical protein [Roseibacillus persicicus]|nr:hypothetical protein [Roseibacillus persicicus]